MSQELLIRSEGNYFLVPDQNNQTRQIPKTNYRSVLLPEDEKAIVSDERKIIIPVSSDLPCNRGFYYEVLSHTKDAVDLDRLNRGGGICLFNHIRGNYLGVIEKAWLEGSRQFNKIRFGTHDLANQIVHSINEKIIRNVSIGYNILELVLSKKAEDDLNTYTATKWESFETSFVDIPADYSVGVGRQYFDMAAKENLGTPENHPGCQNSRNSEDFQSGNWEELNQKLDGLSEEIQQVVKQERDMPEVVINEKDVRQQERERVGGIYALIKKYGHSEIGQRAIDEGLSITEARSLYLDKVKDGQKPVAKTLDPVDLPNNDANKYSFLKAIGVSIGAIKPEKAGLEMEVSQHIQDERMGGKPPQGIYVDQTRLVSYRAPYDTSTPAAAGNLISTDLLADRFIEALYNESAFLSAGVTYMRDLTGNVEIPREDTYTNGYWIGESQPITEDEGTFDKISMNPKKLACLTKFTYEMIHQSSIDLERLMRLRLIRGLALELDRTVGFGSGIGEEPLGIISHPEVLSIVLGANGGALDWASIINMQAEIDAANAMMGNSFCYVVNSRTKAKLQQTLDHTTGSGSWIWRNTGSGDGNIAGYSAKCSNQIPNNLSKGTATNLSAAFFGDFSKVLLGIWAGLDVMADPYSESTNAIIKILAKQLVDVQLTRGSYFCVCSDIMNT